MIKCNINYFSSSLNLNKNILTLDKYLPVAKEVVNIAEGIDHRRRLVSSAEEFLEFCLLWK